MSVYTRLDWMCVHSLRVTGCTMGCTTRTEAGDGRHHACALWSPPWSPPRATRTHDRPRHPCTGSLHGGVPRLARQPRPAGEAAASVLSRAEPAMDRPRYRRSFALSPVTGGGQQQQQEAAAEHGWRQQQQQLQQQHRLEQQQLEEQKRLEQQRPGPEDWPEEEEQEEREQEQLQEQEHRRSPAAARARPSPAADGRSPAARSPAAAAAALPPSPAGRRPSSRSPHRTPHRTPGRFHHRAGRTSRRRDCHFDDTPCLSLLKQLIKVQGVPSK